MCVFFFQAEDGIRDSPVTGVQTCALPIFLGVSYGGSVDSSSSKDILSIKGVQGLLIGGASLQYQEFCNIVLSNN